jgi:hypothetical protein
MQQRKFKPKCEIEILVRNAETLEIEDTRKLTNIVVDAAFWGILGGNFELPGVGGVSNAGYSFPSTIVATTVAMSPSRCCSFIPTGTSGVTDTTQVGINNIPNVTNPTYFAAAGENAQFVEWSTRLGVPAVDLEINTIMLTNLPQNSGSQNSINNGSNANSFAFGYAKLSSPCAQTTNQILDIYYRIQFPQQDNVSDYAYSYVAKVLGGLINQGQPFNQLYTQAYATALPLPVIKEADIPDITMSPNFFYDQISTTLNNYVNALPFFKQKYTQAFSTGQNTGLMIGAVTHSNGYKNLLTATSPYVTSAIQNVFGHTVATTLPFLDIDALPTGTGHFVPSGNWVNKNLPIVSGQYYSGSFPKMINVKIVGGGNTGAATYTYTKRPFLGYNQWMTENNVSNCSQNFVSVIPLSASIAANGGNVSPLGVANPVSGLLGDTTQIGTQHLTSIIPYDDVSVIVPSANRILLYNLAASDYWIYTAAFTDINQVAVSNGLIYVSCGVTGLWKIDPLHGTVTSLATPSAGIDLSATNGVAAGHGNTLWVVGNNGIASFDGNATWNLYNAESTPAFNMTGISDNNWSNVGYLKANASNTSGELLLVYKPIPANNGLLGCWWSLAGTTTQTGLDQATTGNWGQPRINRSHLNCSPNDGVWVVFYNNSFYALPFGTTQSNLVVAGSTIFNSDPIGNSLSPTYASVNFVLGAAGGDRLLAISDVPGGLSNGQAGGYGNIFVVKLDGTGVDLSLTSASNPPPALLLPEQNIAQEFNVTTSSEYAGYGYQDQCITVNLGGGVLFSITAAGFFHGFGFNSSNGSAIYSALYIYPFDISVRGGGPLAYLGKTTYGWNGSAWVAGSTTPKTTHADAEVLDEGISIAFVDGESGTSFVSTEFYNFCLCDGQLQDNATSFTLEDNFYFKKAYINATTVSASSIPAVTAGATGAVGISIKSNSTDTEQDESDNIIFLDQNGLQFSVGDIDLVGDFNVTFAFDPENANMTNIQFGIGYAAFGIPLYSFIVGSDNNLHIQYPNSSYVYANSNQFSSQNLGAASAVSSLAITRTSGVVGFVVNGSPVSLTQDRLSIGVAYSRFNLISTPAFFGNGNTNASKLLANRTCPAATIVSNGSDNAIIAGNAEAETGYYNPLFCAIDTDARNGISVLIAGVPATSIHVDGTVPGPGEVSVDPFMGTFVFNTGDQGKSFFAIYTYLTHE